MLRAYKSYFIFLNCFFVRKQKQASFVDRGNTTVVAFGSTVDGRLSKLNYLPLTLGSNSSAPKLDLSLVAVTSSVALLGGVNSFQGTLFCQFPKPN